MTLQIIHSTLHCLTDFQIPFSFFLFFCVGFRLWYNILEYDNIGLDLYLSAGEFDGLIKKKNWTFVYLNRILVIYTIYWFFVFVFVYELWLYGSVLKMGFAQIGLD